VSAAGSRIQVRLQGQGELDHDVVPPHAGHDHTDDSTGSDRLHRAENIVTGNAIASGGPRIGCTRYPTNQVGCLATQPLQNLQVIAEDTDRDIGSDAGDQLRRERKTYDPPSIRRYGARRAQRNTSLKRGSWRSGSKDGSTFSDARRELFSSQARFRQASASSFRPMPA